MRVVATALVIALAGCQPVARVGSPCAPTPPFAPFDGPRAVPVRELPPTGVLDQLVAWYQHGGRAPTIPPASCPFAPTCSVYAREALHRYGPFGVIAIVDRLLVREHPLAAAYYPTTCVDHTTRLVDAVP